MGHLLGIAVSAMTPARLAHVLSRLRWSGQAAADVLGLNERTMRRWLAGTNAVPDDVGGWLEGAVSWLDANPPPRGPGRVDPVQERWRRCPRPG